MLKTITAIILFLLLAFNWAGYRIMTTWLTHNADQRLEAKIDRNDYDEAALIEIRVPLNMPYITDQPEYERHYGEIEFHGQYYRYVKRKIENGALVLKCIPNDSKRRITAKANEFFKDINGLDGSRQDKKQSTTVKLSLGDYDDTVSSFDIAALPTRCLSPVFPKLRIALPEAFLKAPAQPPDLQS
ncbi:hypothetical protein [Niabella soli]|uniref:Uncharacterized protein n=1 Tax=Niabella soli DSM 19437 TaxID=929713 RepID=W0F7I8_9BACT|nr:hypothetical protein [Niabella soli]AHF17768.1 hypothetical protein NIASO_13915 [Niabella soli DSM 19437]